MEKTIRSPIIPMQPQKVRKGFKLIPSSVHRLGVTAPSPLSNFHFQVQVPQALSLGLGPDGSDRAEMQLSDCHVWQEVRQTPHDLEPKE